MVVRGDEEFPRCIMYVFFPLPMVGADLFVQLIVGLPSRVELANKSKGLCC